MNSKYVLAAGGIAIGLAIGITIGVSEADDLREAARIPEGMMQKVAGNADADNIIPINQIVTRYETDGMRITDIEYDEEFFHDVYELDVVDNNGQEWDIDVDARSGEELSRKKDRD